jgi:hypothetical protein
MFKRGRSCNYEAACNNEQVASFEVFFEQNDPVVIRMNIVASGYNEKPLMHQLYDQLAHYLKCQFSNICKIYALVEPNSAQAAVLKEKKFAEFRRIHRDGRDYVTLYKDLVYAKPLTRI